MIGLLSDTEPQLSRSSVRRTIRRKNTVGLGLLLCAVVLTGCQNGVIHQARSLPAQFAATPPTNPQMFNLSRFAQAASRSELVHPGDLLAVTIATGLEADKPTEWALRVSDSGDLIVPLVGAVGVDGVELTDCERLIRTAAVERGQFVNPNVTVELKDRKSNRVSVVGAVNEPGVKSLPIGQSDLFNALVAAGGLTDNASTVVELRHPDSNPGQAQQAGSAGGPNAEFAGLRRSTALPIMPRQIRYDLREITAGASGDFHVEDGTMVVVSPKPKEHIQVIGLVRKSDRFEMQPGQEIRLLDALAMANGRTLEFANKVRIIRRIPNQAEPVVIQTSVRDAKRGGPENLMLAAGDVVSVEETPLTFVVGTVREFVRFGFSSAIPGF